MALKADQKKILLFVDWFYPGYKAGGPIQSCRNFIAALENDYRIDVITSDRDLGDTQPYAAIRANEWNAYSDSARVYYTASLNAALIQELVKASAPDFIYLNSMFSYRFTILLLALKWRKRITAPVIVAPRGMLQEGALQFKRSKKKLFIGLLNLGRLPGKLVFHATDAQEKADIQKAFPSATRVVCIPNFTRNGLEPLKHVEKNPGELHCVYVSRLAPKKNILYFLQLLGKIPGAPVISFVIRGEIEDKTYWQQCREAIDTLPGNISIRFDGPVQNDVIIPFLQEYHLFVLPTLGENFGHAIVEALAAGRPVLISDKTPWTGLAYKKAGWEIPLENEPGFIAAVQKMAAMDQPEYNEWCSGAWQLANDLATQTELKQQYLKLFN